MPFTPLHLGPGILVKALLQGSFSLMVFAWAQIVMDIQPLIAILSGASKFHGFTHSYLGALFIAVFCALTGKYLSQAVLSLFAKAPQQRVDISWRVAFLSACVGTYSHVLLDGMMHTDLEPLWPLTALNPLLGLVSIASLHKFCFYTGLIGAFIYIAINYLVAQLARRQPAEPAATRRLS